MIINKEEIRKTDLLVIVEFETNEQGKTVIRSNLFDHNVMFSRLRASFPHPIHAVPVTRQSLPTIFLPAPFLQHS